jgi:hypothetical protein
MPSTIDTAMNIANLTVRLCQRGTRAISVWPLDPAGRPPRGMKFQRLPDRPGFFAPAGVFVQPFRLVGHCFGLGSVAIGIVALGTVVFWTNSLVPLTLAAFSCGIGLARKLLLTPACSKTRKLLGIVGCPKRRFGCVVR